MAEQYHMHPGGVIVIEIVTTLVFRLEHDGLTPETILAAFEEAVAQKRKLLTNTPEASRRIALALRKEPEGDFTVDLWKTPIKPQKRG